MFDEILRELNVLKYGADSNLVKEVRTGRFTIERGFINVDMGYETRFVIRGSANNDGVHVYPGDLTDETFDGTVYILRTIKAFEELVADIESWQNDHKNKIILDSESFSGGGYSYTRAKNSRGQSVSWKTEFAERLRPWRKL